MRHAFFLTLVVILFGCRPSYEIIYRTTLDTEETELKHFEDERLAFDFITAPNGIYFKVLNKTDTTGYIVWDKSYFIEPNGNSYKALNTDILEVKKSIADKENYESIIPSNGKFMRFTTSTTNFNELTSYNTSTIINYFSNYDILTSRSYNNSFFTIGNYWITEIEPNPNQTQVSDESYFLGELESISDKMVQENNLGLGLAIRMGSNLFEYRFDFKVQEIEIYENNEGRLRLIKVSKSPKFDVWKTK